MWAPPGRTSSGGSCRDGHDRSPLGVHAGVITRDTDVPLAVADHLPVGVVMSSYPGNLQIDSMVWRDKHTGIGREGVR